MHPLCKQIIDRLSLGGKARAYVMSMEIFNSSAGVKFRCHCPFHEHTQEELSRSKCLMVNVSIKMWGCQFCKQTGMVKKIDYDATKDKCFAQVTISPPLFEVHMSD